MRPIFVYMAFATPALVAFVLIAGSISGGHLRQDAPLLAANLFSLFVMTYCEIKEHQPNTPWHLGSYALALGAIMLAHMLGVANAGGLHRNLNVALNEMLH